MGRGHRRHNGMSSSGTAAVGSALDAALIYEITPGDLDLFLSWKTVLFTGR